MWLIFLDCWFHITAPCFSFPVSLHVLPTLPEVFTNRIDPDRLKGRNNCAFQALKSVITMCPCIALGFPPHSLDRVKLTVELWDEYCTMPLFLHQAFKSSFFVLEVCVVCQDNSHVCSFHTSGVYASFLEYEPHSLRLPIAEDHFLYFPVPHCVPHSGLGTTRTYIHPPYIQSVVLECTMTATLVKKPHLCIFVRRVFDVCNLDCILHLFQESWIVPIPLIPCSKLENLSCAHTDRRISFSRCSVLLYAQL